MNEGLARDTGGELMSADAFRQRMLASMRNAGLKPEVVAEVEQRFEAPAEDRKPLWAPSANGQNIADMRRRTSGLDGDQLRNTFNAYRTENEETRLAAKRAGVRFVHDVKTGTRTKGLHFYGRPGRGKDHLLHAITIELADAGIDVYYGYSLDLKHKMLEEWMVHKDPETAIEERMSNCNVLLIGDLHKVLYIRPNEGVRDREVREAFTRVINKASSVGSPLLCISGNINPKDYASRDFGGYDDPANQGSDIDGAIYSRLQGCTKALEVKGQDMRQAQR